MNIPLHRKIIYTVIAPFFIGVWCVLNPKKLWEQLKRELKPK